MSRNSIGDGKGLEIYKGHSPLASGARQAPDFTYSHSAASTKHKHRTHKHIANTYDQVPVKHPTHTHIANTYAKYSKHSQHQVPVKHHNIPLLHIDRSRGVIVANNLATLNHNTHTHTLNIHCTTDKEGSVV